MKTLKKLTGIILAVLLLFSSLGGAVSSVAAESQAPVAEEVQVQTLSGEDEDNSIVAVLEGIIAKIKKVILILVGNISIFLDGNYSRLDVSDYSESIFAVPGLDKGFVPQGICYIEFLDSFAISGYIKGENSRIYLISNETGEVKELILKDFSKHAGGIASDGSDVWISAGGDENEGGFVYHLSATTLSWASDGEEIEFDGSFRTQVRASTICCDGEMLYVAEFYEKDDYPVNPSHSFEANKAWAVGYELPIISDYDGKEKQPDVVLSIPEKVQGMSVTDDGNILFSTSYGRFYDSTLHVYEPLEKWSSGEVIYNGEAVKLYVAEDASLISKVRMPTLMEGIDVEGSKLYVVFESGATAYSDAKQIITDVKKVSINALIDELA